MKSFIAIAAALAAIVVCSAGTAQAQTRLHTGGFPFPGGGFQQGFAGTEGAFGGFRLRREQPPFFAKFPPVYYSHAVKRPYGISPYAAPAGVAPVELAYARPESKPVVIHNPYFNNDNPESAMDAKIKMDTEVKVETKAKRDTKVKTKAKQMKTKIAGWYANPFFENQFASN